MDCCLDLLRKEKVMSKKPVSKKIVLKKAELERPTRELEVDDPELHKALSDLSAILLHPTIRNYLEDGGVIDENTILTPVTLEEAYERLEVRDSNESTQKQEELNSVTSDIEQPIDKNSVKKLSTFKLGKVLLNYPEDSLPHQLAYTELAKRMVTEGEEKAKEKEEPSRYRRLVNVSVPVSVISRLFLGRMDFGDWQGFRDLPWDAVCVDVYIDPEKRSLYATFEHKRFKKVWEGSAIPIYSSGNYMFDNSVYFDDY